MRRRVAPLLLAAKCLLLVIFVRIGLLTLPYRALARLIPRASGTAPAGKLRRTAWGVSRAARWVPGATCLTQALAAQYILARSGFACDIRIGVRRDPGGDFRAHAWLLSGETLVLGGDAEEFHAFTVLTDLSSRAL